jgi:hypothetical protein
LLWALPEPCADNGYIRGIHQRVSPIMDDPVQAREKSTGGNVRFGAGGIN